MVSTLLFFFYLSLLSSCCLLALAKAVIRLSMGGMKELADVSTMKGFVDTSPLAFAALKHVR